MTNQCCNGSSIKFRFLWNVCIWIYKFQAASHSFIATLFLSSLTRCCVVWLSGRVLRLGRGFVAALLSSFGSAFAAAAHQFPLPLCRAHISMCRIVAQFYRAIPSLCVCVSLCAFLLPSCCLANNCYTSAVSSVNFIVNRQQTVVPLSCCLTNVLLYEVYFRA